LNDSAPEQHEYADERDDPGLWAVACPEREPATTVWFLPTVLVLLGLGTPWHAAFGWSVATWVGLPAWVWISVGSAGALSIVTAVAAIRFWSDPELDQETERGERAGGGA
jgi:hypothetical protein